MDAAEALFTKRLEIATTKKDGGKYYSEADLNQKYDAERVKKIKAFCIRQNQWRFDIYDPQLVLYAVYTDLEFDSMRLCQAMLILIGLRWGVVSWAT